MRKTTPDVSQKVPPILGHVIPGYWSAGGVQAGVFHFYSMPDYDLMDVGAILIV